MFDLSVCEADSGFGSQAPQFLGRKIKGVTGSTDSPPLTHLHRIHFLPDDIRNSIFGDDLSGCSIHCLLNVCVENVVLFC